MTGVAISPLPPSPEVLEQGIYDVVREATGDMRETKSLSRFFGPDLPIVDSDDELSGSLLRLCHLCSLYESLAGLHATYPLQLRQVLEGSLYERMDAAIADSFRPVVTLLIKGRQLGSMRAVEVR